MLIEKVVINASPFILLCKSGLTELLPRLFSEIIMPEAVAEEIIRGDDIASERIYDFEKTWLRRHLTSQVADVLAWNLGDGETEVLSAAIISNENITVLLDDRAARKCAQTLGIRTLGTAGLLVLAKKRKLVSNVKSELEKLKIAGLYLSDDICTMILEQANELS